MSTNDTSHPSHPRLKEVYRAFSPAPLTVNQAKLYIPLDEVRGKQDVLHRLAKRIRLSDGPVSQVLAGHKGSGKSTELMRLQQDLEQGDEKFFVVLARADDDIDRNDVDFPEILIAVVRQLARQLHERANITLEPGYFRDRWERIKGLLGSEVSFEGLSLEAGMFKVASTLKDSPSARKKLRELLEPDTTNWLNAANDVIGEALLALKKKGYAGLVVLVDDLDKMIVRPMDHAGCSTTEYLFIHRAAQLTAFRCHTVYTLPLSLAYSHHEQAIRRDFGGHVPVVPMVKVATPPPDSKAHPAGVKKMREMVAVRCTDAGITEADLFKNKKVQDDLIRLSGGQPSELMVLIREALLAGGMPIGPEGLARVRREGEREYARILRREHWPILIEVRKKGNYARSANTEDVFRELLDSRTILQYVNDKEWYGLNPMLAHQQPPAEIEG